MKFVAVVFILLFSQGGFAHDHSTGVHGMVLMQVGERIIASHMPLHNSKHAHQIIIELDATNSGNDTIIKGLLAKHSLVTLMPEVFSLSQLQNGALKSFKGTVYIDHFERQGRGVIANVSFAVKQVLLNKPIMAVDNGVYYVLNVDKQLSLLVHRIGKLPSFDQILLVSYAVSKPSLTQVALVDKPQEAEQALGSKAKGYKFEKQLYLETQDFLK